MIHIIFIPVNTSYNAFKVMNMMTFSLLDTSTQIAALLSTLASPQRIAILLAIGRGEACVCHLEAMLGWRQAYISQHLMVLRKANILQDQRQGRYVFYTLTHPALLDWLTDSAAFNGVSPQAIAALNTASAPSSCECPHCLACDPAESL